MNNNITNELTTIPDFTNYSITKDGRVFKTSTFKQILPSKGKYQYLTLISDAGTKETVSKQYLLNKTFPKKNLLVGFKPIENYNRYLLSEYGEVWDTVKLKFLKYCFLNDKPRVRLTNNNGETNNVSVPSLLRCYFPDSMLLVSYPEDVENFMDIPNYPDYMVSKDGRVWNKKSGKFKTVHQLQNGYLAATLTNETFKNNVLLHRILATTFLPNPDNLPVVQHLDDDKLNNNLDNLKWSTQKENMQTASKNGRMNNTGFRLPEEHKKEIAQRWQQGELRKDIAVQYGISVMTVDRYKNN